MIGFKIQNRLAYKLQMVRLRVQIPCGEKFRIILIRTHAINNNPSSTEETCASNEVQQMHVS